MRINVYKISQTIRRFNLIVIYFIFCFGCNDPEVEPVEKFKLNISKSSILSQAGEGSFKIEIESNTSWSIKTNANWLSLSKSEGSGDDYFSINWTKNSSSSSRTALVEVSSGEITETIEVVQSNDHEIIEYFPIVGNTDLGIPNLVYVLFKSDVKVKEIVSKYEGCFNEIHFEYLEKTNAIVFNYLCFELGGDYVFDIEIEDLNGIIFRETIEVNFYTRKVEIDGFILDYTVSEKDNSYWVITDRPNGIYQISMNDMSIISHYNFPFKPKKLAINYLRNELYILSSEPEITVLDAITGTFKRTIIVPSDGDDHPDAPEIYPYDINFTKSGLGIILLGSPLTSAISWKMIDTRNNDMIFIHPQYDQFNTPKDSLFANFTKIYVNHDQSKLLLSDPWGGPGLTILSQDSEKLYYYMPPTVSRQVSITPNRKNNNIYFCQLLNQLITDYTTGYASNNFYLWNRFNGSGDFSYKENEFGIIYFCDDYSLMVLDHNEQIVRFNNKVRFGMRGTTTTTDGKFLILYNPLSLGRDNKNIHSTIFQFSTKDLITY